MAGGSTPEGRLLVRSDHVYLARLQSSARDMFGDLLSLHAVGGNVSALAFFLREARYTVRADQLVE